MSYVIISFKKHKSVDLFLILFLVYISVFFMTVFVFFLFVLYVLFNNK